MSVIKKFSTALQSNSEGGHAVEELDEAGAILQDVLDNINEVSQILGDWITTNENPFRKHFLSPAKRVLIYVDTTLDFPAILFSDVLVFFEYPSPSPSLHLLSYH